MSSVLLAGCGSSHLYLIVVLLINFTDVTEHILLFLSSVVDTIAFSGSLAYLIIYFHIFCRLLLFTYFQRSSGLWVYNFSWLVASASLSWFAQPSYHFSSSVLTLDYLWIYILVHLLCHNAGLFLSIIFCIILSSLICFLFKNASCKMQTTSPLPA